MSETELEPSGENKQITERDTHSLQHCFLGQVRGPLTDYLLTVTTDQTDQYFFLFWISAPKI